MRLEFFLFLHKQEWLANIRVSWISYPEQTLCLIIKIRKCLTLTPGLNFEGCRGR
jgi:hypothetical protein